MIGFIGACIYMGNVTGPCLIIGFVAGLAVGLLF